MAMKRTIDLFILNKWIWIIVFGCAAVIVGPVLIIYLIVLVPAPLKVAATFGIMIGWGVAGGYKDWILAKRQEQKILSKATEA